MKVLVYCLFLEAERKPPLLRGVNGRPVHIVTTRGLCAASSAVSESDLAPTMERIRAYERVVEAIFADRAVVPMRYGSVLPSRDDVLHFLRDEEDRYSARLRELAGCVEMGLRLVGPLDTTSRRVAKRRARRVVRPASTPGRAYLQSREKRYQGESNPNADMGALIERYRRAFEDLSVEFRAEPAVPLRLVLGVSKGQLQLSTPKRKEDRSLALYFLVRRESVPAFRQRVRRLDDDTTQIQLSGPWPPYNFVAVTSAPSTNEDRERRAR